jgi:PST family polysaccharide transporter
LNPGRITLAAAPQPKPATVHSGESPRSREETRRLFDNVAALAVLQAASFLLPLATLPYLARVLGPQRFGIVAFAQSALQYLIILTDFGFNLSATRSLSVIRDDPDAVSRIFTSVMVLKALLAVAGGGLLALAVFLAPAMRHEWRVFLFAYGLVAGNVLFPVWFFQGIERMRFIAALTVLAKLIFTALVFSVVRSDADYAYVPLLNSTGTVVAGLLSLWVAVKRCGARFVRPRVHDLRVHFRESLGYFASRVSVTMYTSSNAFLLGLTSTPTAVGLYSSAERIYGAMQGVYSPVTNSLVPYMARTRDRSLFAKVLGAATAVNTAGCLVLVVFSKVIVRTAFGPSYEHAGPILAALGIAMMFVLPTFLLGYPFLAAFGFASYANRSAIIGSLFHLTALATLFALGHLRPLPVAATVAATEAIVLALRLDAVRRTGIWRNRATAA